VIGGKSFRLLATILIAGIVSAAFGGFLAVMLIAVATAGVVGFVNGWFLGLFGAVCAVPVAALPAILLGSALWGLRVRNPLLWAITGAAAGVSCLYTARYFPGAIGEMASMTSDPDWKWFPPACAIAGAGAALFFRKIMRSFTEFENLLAD
jgi:hypothetical protein